MRSCAFTEGSASFRSSNSADTEMVGSASTEKVRQRVRQNGTLAHRLDQMQVQMAQLTAAQPKHPLTGAAESLETRARAKIME